MGDDDDIVELLWHNGRIVGYNHSQRPPTSDKPPPPTILRGSGSSGQGEGGGEDENTTIPQQKQFEQNLFIQEEEMASWLQPQVSFSFTQPPPPLSSQYTLPSESPASGSFTNFSMLRGNFTRSSVPVVRESAHVGSSATSSSSTIESCVTPPMVIGGVSHTIAVPGLGQKNKEVAIETGTELIQTQPARETETADEERKRKERDETNEETEQGTRGSTARKRSRTAEMHNLSEKRRRGRINEKMKDLRELLPHCNKSDKASMLDDVISHVKFLQMQFQMMLMGGGTMPMMYPHMAMNRPPPQYMPLPPRQAHIVPQPNLMLNQPQFQAYMNPYSQFVGHHQMQQTPPLQNQTTSQLSFSQASCSKENEDQNNKPTG